MIRKVEEGLRGYSRGSSISTEEHTPRSNIYSETRRVERTRVKPLGGELGCRWWWWGVGGRGLEVHGTESS